MTIGKTGIKQQIETRFRDGGAAFAIILLNTEGHYTLTSLATASTAIKLKQNLVLLRIVYTNKMWPTTKYLKQIVGMLIGSFDHPALKSKIVIGQLEHDIKILKSFSLRTLSASYIRCLWVL